MMKLPRRLRLRSLLVALAAIMVIAPTAAIASHNFGDVPDTNIFHADIEWMLDNGITSGCGSGNYCPSDNVTREQMAAFMRRLSTTKVVNAATAETAVSATNADHATTADSATTATSAATAATATTATSATTAASADSLMGTLPGAFAAPLTFSFNSLTAVEAAAIDVTVPGPGLLVVTVQGSVWINADSASTSSLTTYARLALCADSAVICSIDSWVYYSDPDNASSTNSTPSFSLTMVLPVAAAGTETVYLNGLSQDGYTVSHVDSTNMVAVFLPGDGTANLSGSVSVASESGNQQDSE